jgi:hypothetical protein
MSAAVTHIYEDRATETKPDETEPPQSGAVTLKFVAASTLRPTKCRS